MVMVKVRVRVGVRVPLRVRVKPLVRKRATTFNFKPLNLNIICYCKLHCTTCLNHTMCGLGPASRVNVNPYHPARV